MKIAANTISAVTSFYKKELSSIYDEGELNNIIRWVLQKQLDLTGADLVAEANTRINESDMTPLEKMCYELKAHKPIQYVLGEAEFYGLKFFVNENVLIPRPETEELVEMVIKDISSLSPRTSHLVSRTSPLVLDIGTGSGCVPISIKKNLPDVKILGLDVSDKALEIARRNASVNHVNVDFFKTDILSDNAAESILGAAARQKIDVIVSNPPYVLQGELASLHERVSKYEPQLALFVPDADPLLFYRKIARVASEILESNGKLWFECHSDHAVKVEEMLRKMKFRDVTLRRDLSGSARFTEATRSL